MCVIIGEFVSSDQNETAIDLIYKTYELLKKMEQQVSELSLRHDELSKKIDVLDYSNKLLNNRFTKLQNSLSDSIADPGAKSVKNNEKETAKKTPPASFMAKAVYDTENSKPSRKVDKIILGNIKVFSYILNQKKEPVSGVEIDIYNESNELVKVRDTDEMGYVEFKLPPGNYKAEVRQKGFSPLNIEFSLTEGMKEFNLR